MFREDRINIQLDKLGTNSQFQVLLRHLCKCSSVNMGGLATKSAQRGSFAEI